MIPTASMSWDEDVETGRDIGSALENDERRFGILISADLAHTHESSGPYGFCKCAEPFDTYAGLWAETMQSTYIRKKSRREQQLGAKSCGSSDTESCNMTMNIVSSGSQE